MFMCMQVVLDTFDVSEKRSLAHEPSPDRGTDCRADQAKMVDVDVRCPVLVPLLLCPPKGSLWVAAKA